MALVLTYVPGKRGIHRGLVSWAAAACLFLLPQDALAYVDPGSTSIVLQVLFATGIGVLISTWKSIGRFIRSFIRGLKHDK